MKFRPVDKIISWESERKISGVKAVSFEEYMLRSPLGYPEALPESLIMGAFLSLAEWLVFLSTDFKKCCTFKEITSFLFLDMLKPGERMLMNIRVEKARDTRWVFQGAGLVGERPIAEFPLMIADLSPVSERYDPDDLRVLFSEILQPEKNSDM